MGTLVLAIRRDGYALRTLRHLRWTSCNAQIYGREGTSWVRLGRANQECARPVFTR